MTAPFISSADLAAYIKEDSVDDALATIAIDAACERVRGYVHQELGATSVVDEWIDGTGTSVLFLDAMPVNNVTAVSASLDRTDTLPETLVLNTDYVVKSKHGIIKRIDGGVFPYGAQNIKVSYDYGSATVPSDARLVALQVAARIYDVGQIENESLGGMSATYVAGAGNLTPDEKDMLRRYRID